MEQMMRSSLAGMEIGHFKKQEKNSKTNFKFFRNPNAKLPYSVPVVIDAVEKKLSAILAGTDTENTPKFKWIYGKAGNVKSEINLAKFISDVTQDFPETTKTLKVCNEEGQFLDLNLKIGYIYNNFKNTSDNILYLMITYESTIYDYIVSLFKTFFKKATSFW